MKQKDIISIAKYIQFPYANMEYKKISEKEIYRLPIIKDREILYPKMRGNEHHYTTWYTYNYVLPLISKLLKFNFNIDDFNLIPLKLEIGDLSYLFPKKDNNYTIICYTDNEKIKGSYKDLFEPIFFENPSYRPLYRYHHRCSRIINHSINNNRKLMISGDSQSVPSIAPLTNYFKEVWYFDNRTGWIRNKITKEYEFLEDKFISFKKNYEDTIFTDVLIQLYCRNLNWYEYWNLY